MTEKEVEGIQPCIARNRPYVDEAWQSTQAKRWVFCTPSVAQVAPKRPNRKTSYVPVSIPLHLTAAASANG